MNQVNPTLAHRITALRWTLPATLALLTVLYQLGLARCL